MTDHLTHLLQEQATGLEVPAAPAVAVLAEGRAIRRRHRSTVAASAAAIAVIAVVAGGLAVGTQRGDREPEPARPSDAAAYQTSGAWAIDDEVHVGNHVVVVPGAERLSYTSEGVVVLTHDGQAVLARPDGDTEPLDLDLFEPSGAWGPIGTDPRLPYLAFERVLPDGRVQATVRDLATGRETEVGRPVRPRDNESYVAEWLSGDFATFSSVDQGRFVEWRTGASADVVAGWWYAAGVSLDVDIAAGRWTARTFDGDLLLRVTPPDSASTYASLSPDGRYLAFTGSDPTITVYSLATGESQVIRDRAMPTFGWTPDGHLVGTPSAAGGEVEICDPATATCRGTGTEVDAGLTVVSGVPGRTV